jgi:hypothetical protein
MTLVHGIAYLEIRPMPGAVELSAGVEIRRKEYDLILVVSDSVGCDRYAVSGIRGPDVLDQIVHYPAAMPLFIKLAAPLFHKVSDPVSIVNKEPIKMENMNMTTSISINVKAAVLFISPRNFPVW